jgi:hypothetical protein
MTHKFHNVDSEINYFRAPQLVKQFHSCFVTVIFVTLLKIIAAGSYFEPDARCPLLRVHINFIFHFYLGLRSCHLLKLAS